jgi:hypothetical protein
MIQAFEPGQAVITYKNHHGIVVSVTASLNNPTSYLVLFKKDDGSEDEGYFTDEQLAVDESQ